MAKRAPEGSKEFGSGPSKLDTILEALISSSASKKLSEGFSFFPRAAVHSIERSGTYFI